ncbi:MAG: neutral zinc metallopeptidase [Pirellulaceae bacterium]|nr:neutral zinc metallopeptidase [Pirellulaceae bacterium]
MRLDGKRESGNVDDRRGQRGGRGPLMVGGGIGSIVIVLIVLFLGGDPTALLQQLQQGNPGNGAPAGLPADPGQAAANDEVKRFASQVLASTEDVWDDIFVDLGKQYQKPTMVIFSDQVRSACGGATSAVGPFYCPADQDIYLDLGFFRELETRFGAPGDFAQAYVIAHEVGHHVQNLLGISDQVHAQQQRVSKEEANALSVRLELQADFFAGVWAHHANRTQKILEPGDVEEGLRAANAIGDDRLQQESRGYVVPDSFTHGSSAQRVRWFRKGFETGDMSQSDTFSAAEL